MSSGGLLEQAIGEGTGAVEQILTDIAGWAGNEAVDFVWDATNSDGEDAIEGEVNEEGDFVFEGGDIAVTIPDFQLPTQETEEGGGGGGADSGGGDTGSVGGGGDVADPEWTYRGDGVWVNNSGEWYRVETTGDEQIGDTISTDGLIDVYGNPIESGVDFEAGDPTQEDTRQDEVIDLLGGMIGQVGGSGSGEAGETTDPGEGDSEDPAEEPEGDGTTRQEQVTDLLGGMIGAVGSGAGDGTGNGNGNGEGDGDGDGDGDGSGMGSGLMAAAAGSAFAPQWGELFKYTTITPAQQKKLAPMFEYIKQAKDY